MTGAVSCEELMRVYDRVQPFIHRTPVLTSSSFNRMTGATCYFKCENFQKMGAFKMRGAVNAILRLTEEQKHRGVVTHSSGNFAQALALAAQQQGVKAYIVMPSNAPVIKKKAVVGYGGKIIECEPTVSAREATAEKVQQETSATFVHPYDDYRVIAGQATVAKELIEDVPGVDVIVVPVGGGGLISGTCLAVKYFSPQTQVIGAEPAGANDAYLSLQKGKRVLQTNPQTIADGLRTSLGEKNWPIIRDQVSEIICVDEEAIKTAMKWVWERMKIVIEPSAAVPVAVVMQSPEKFSEKKVGILLSGGNVDLDRLPFQS